MTNSGRHTAWLAALALAVCLPPTPHAQTLDPERAAQVRAGLVLNFLRFTEWPPGSFESDASSVVVSVIGDEAVARNLETLARGERIGTAERTVRVQHESLPPAAGNNASLEEFLTRLQKCHLLFVGRTEADRIDWLLRHLNGKPLLTVSDAAQFAENGGMVGLVVRDGRMSFDVAPTRIRQAGIDLSSKVLRLGRVVERP